MNRLHVLEIHRDQFNQEMLADNTALFGKVLSQHLSLLGEDEILKKIGSLNNPDVVKLFCSDDTHLVISTGKISI